MEELKTHTGGHYVYEENHYIANDVTGYRMCISTN